MANSSKQLYEFVKTRIPPDIKLLAKQIEEHSWIQQNIKMAAEYDNQKAKNLVSSTFFKQGF